MNLFKSFTKILLLTSFLFLGACSQQKEPANTLRVGVIAGPEEKLMETAKQVAANRLGLNIDIIQFSDYTMPNAALSDGRIDANMFQSLPY
jgi:D-methionine transport system substrate-binding protein